ncbi:TIGR03086 family metal-binding protein [Kitasatospora sp. SUK 42]|uniref:TIGR03086 family metal-binding protein n=1 Tax=Kitasatospora sp. SUK 42 TaxID=1588882 RepID=UPI0018C94F6F|nr:TIGR03086 family metal-binding protein [Kitasatospora sp. SUK 42]MBV2156586.1 TIGR03086 family protein [Kitasatospora sp. SUK 42]
MTANDLELLNVAGAAFEAVLKEVKQPQLTEPSTCDGWSVRELVAHVVSGNLMFVRLVTGADVAPGEDVLGDDPVRAFRESQDGLWRAFSGEGVLERVFQTPMGERPASRLVAVRVVELGLHGWDLARSTGQAIDLPEPVMTAALAQLRMMLPDDRSGLPFGVEREAPEGASAADRLAAFAGRVVE